MGSLAYVAPATAEEAVRALAAADGLAKPLAGGTDLLAQLRTGRTRPDLIVDTKRIPGMIGVREAQGGFVIGAATPSAQLGEHPSLGAVWPGLVEAAGLIGSTQIQGRATLAGNLCNASPAADSVPAMMVAGVMCMIAGPDGEREAPVEAICIAPGRTSLAKGEFITAFRLPPRKPNSGDAYLRFIPRTEMDIAVVGCGVSVTLSETGYCTKAHVALGAVAPTALLVPEAADALIGRRLDEGALAALELAARLACKPIDDKRGTAEYRIKVAGVLARRAAAIAFERAGATR